MPPAKFTYDLPSDARSSVVREDGIESGFIGTLQRLKYHNDQVKQIVSCIHQYCGNGTIWHTTGSGKTLTSFNASTLLKDNPDAKRGFRDRRKQTRFIDARATNGLAATLNPFSCN